MSYSQPARCLPAPSALQCSQKYLFYSCNGGIMLLSSCQAPRRSFHSQKSHAISYISLQIFFPVSVRKIVKKHVFGCYPNNSRIVIRITETRIESRGCEKGLSDSGLPATLPRGATECGKGGCGTARCGRVRRGGTRKTRRRRNGRITVRTQAPPEVRKPGRPDRTFLRKLRTNSLPRTEPWGTKGPRRRLRK